MRGEDIAERLVTLAVRTIRFQERLPRNRATLHIGLQLVRSVTSGGANFEEARRAESRNDFVHKVAIASKELAESLYWLRILNRLSPTADTLALLAEAEALLKILVACGRTARNASVR
jgi:four helix bundle protein